jgi:hypothetical protein
MPTTDDTPPTLADQLHAFNEARRQVLQGRPIDPEGEGALGRLLFDPPPEDGPYEGLDR